MLAGEFEVRSLLVGDNSRAIATMIDDSSDSPSRTSENVHLLRFRRKTRLCPSSSYYLPQALCASFVLLLFIITLLLLIAFFHVRQTQFKCEPKGSPFVAKLHENPDKLNLISRQLSSEFVAANVKKSLNFLAKSAHIAGTKESLHMMQFLSKEYESLGFSVKVYNYTTLLNYPHLSTPNTVHVEGDDDDEWKLVSSGRGTVLGPSEAIKEQEDIRGQLWWNAYSANGTVEGQIVYCNYGMKDDFEQLVQMGVELRGRIGLMRYGGMRRSEKVRQAQLRGMLGVLLFSDPTHYTSVNKTNVFPDSIYLPGDDAQRGSVLATHGDPLTPLLPSLYYVHREENEESARNKGVLPKILVTPIGYNDAKKVMDLLDGEPVPFFEWRGGLSSIYRVTGEKTFRVTVHSRFVHRTISNVIATLPGAEEPDRWVMLGNHVDAWVNGAIDPISGTATQLEIARVFSKVFKNSPPRRTLVFCHWDAEEFGLIGSTEWVEEMQHILAQKAVAYINVDHIAGDTTPDVKGVPLLYRTIVNAAKKTRQPNVNERAVGRTRLFDSWRHYRGKGPILGDRAVPDIGLPTAGSDYQRFISFCGIPSADLKIENSPGLSYPLYHTMYETPWLVNNLMDPSYSSFVAVGQMWMEILHRLANSLIIPFNVVDYANLLSTLVPKLESHLTHLNISHTIPTVSDQLFMLKDALRRFGIVARTFQEGIEDIASGAKSATLLEVESLNNRLQSIERCFIDATRGNQLDRHVVFASSRNSPHAAFLAPIQEAARLVAQHGRGEDALDLALGFSKLQFAIESVIHTLNM